MIFLTGGTGLLGRNIIDELRERSIPVRALVRDEAGARVVASLGATPATGTVESAEAWEHASGCGAIIHSAAIIAGSRDWSRYQLVNVEGTRLAASVALRLGVPLLHISSVAVYGRGYRKTGKHGGGEDQPFTPLHPHELYARSKREAEAVVWEHAKRGLRAAAFRPCVVYGPGDRLFFPSLVARLRGARRVPLIGGGRRPLPLVHARNVAQGIVLALDNERAWGESFNLTNDGEITAREFVAAVGRGLGTELPTVNVPAVLAITAARMADSLRRFLPPSRYPGSAMSAVRFWRGGNPYSSARARELLGWRPGVRHGEAVEGLAAGSREQEEGSRE